MVAIIRMLSCSSFVRFLPWAASLTYFASMTTRVIGDFHFFKQRTIRTAHRQHAGNLRMRHTGGIVPDRQHHGGVGADQHAVCRKRRRRIDNRIEDGIQLHGPALHLGEQLFTLLLSLFTLSDVVGDADNRGFAVILDQVAENPATVPGHLCS